MELIRYTVTVIFLALGAASMSRPIYLLATKQAEERTRANVIRLFGPIVIACGLATAATIVAPYDLVNMFAWVFAIMTVSAIALMIVIDWRLTKDNTEG